MLFLSLFYIRKLFPSGLRIIHGYPVHDQAKIVFRAFCIALLLAFKWLDDFEPRIGDRPPIVEDDHWREKRKDPTKYRSCWSDFMTMSIAEVQAVEVSALVVLDWNISISTPDWYFWLDELHDYTVVEPESTSYATVAQLIVAAQEELDQTCPDASFMSSLSLEGSRARSPEPLSRLARALLVGINPPFESPFPVTPEYALEVETGWASSSRRELCCSSEIDGGQWATPTELRHSSEGWASPVCFTAELRCSEDEIVRGPTRVIGYAPGPSPYTLTLSDSEHSRDSDSSIDFLHHEDIRARIPHAGVQRDDSPLYDDSQPLTPVFLDPWNCYTATGLYL
ncbi:hypothetical protein GYMLUDRAFT_39018 [Collybiopsis luxurians FD-317 M1]|nr:hypothetical protein GYMLUDRAFT_39018 [Collybiopsis luxurians FD-317 M1]